MTSLLSALEQVIGTEAMQRAERWNAAQSYDAGADLDEDTLRRSFGGLSRGARRVQRRPKRWVQDELGYWPDGSWTECAE